MMLQPGAGFGLLAASLAVLFFGFFGLALSHGRGHYLVGLIGAFASYVIALLLPEWAFASLPLPNAASSPAIEEPIRVFGAFVLLSHTNDRGSWLAFALGYALLESSLKFGDNAIGLGQGGDALRAAALLSIPVVPLTLHVFLGVVAMRLRSMGASALLTLLVTFLLHTAHNFSALVLPRPEDWSFVLFETWARSLAFVLLVVLIISPSRGKARGH